MVNEGDYLYRLEYEQSLFTKDKRILSKKKIKKVDIRYNCIRFFNNESVSLNAIDNLDVNEWFSSKKKMYETKIKLMNEEYKYILAEIKYLKKKQLSEKKK